MGAVLFYHLSRSTVEDTARTLLTRAQGAGWRVVIRGRTDARLDALDAALWQGPDDAFLPHGRSGGPHDADQPVLLTNAPGAGEDVKALMLLEGALLAPDEARRLERVWVMFDGADADATAVARDQWRGVVAAGLAAQYWSEEGGRWQMKTEQAARA